MKGVSASLSSAPPLAIGQCATLACLLEATASKPGNVHRGADFEDLRFEQFVVSAVAIAPAIDRAAAGGGVGAAILEAVKLTQDWAASNTNLGTLLLIAPLAAVPRSRRLDGSEVHKVLDSLTPADSAAVYQAISLAQPGGMGEVAEMDIGGPAPSSLVEAMRAASARDLVARQYINGFQEVFLTRELLTSGIAAGLPISGAIIHAQLQLLHSHPDSLIARKAGLHVAEQASWQAGQVLKAGPPGSDDYQAALADFDFWLRSDGHQRNPGTTADLIAAGLFAALRDQQLRPPLAW